MTMSLANTTPNVPVDVRELESTTPPLPHRSTTSSGYRSETRTWPDFQYTSSAERRSCAVRLSRDIFERSLAEQEEAGLSLQETSDTLPALPLMKIVLIGGPCSGKGTIAPLLSQALRTRVVSVGQLLRGEVRSGTVRGAKVREVMERGELLQDDLVLDLVRQRVTDSWDAQQNGWQLVGFPRTPEQARAIASDDSEYGLKPDCVIVLQRPEELAKEFALGRMTDSATGKTFHPDYAPPPSDVAASGRLVWRSDDTTEVVARRIHEYNSNLQGILDEFEKEGVPVQLFDNARSECDTFADIIKYVEDLGRNKLDKEGGWEEVWRKRYGSGEGLSDLPDVDPLCDLMDVGAEDCLYNWSLDSDADRDSAAPTSPWLAAVRRCNTYSPRDFVPVLIGNYQVGWSSRTFVEELAPHLLLGRAVELVQLLDDKTERKVTQEDMLDIKGYGLAMRLAPLQNALQDRTDTLAALVQELVDEGIISKKSIRRELQDVRPISVGFLAGEAGEAQPPLLKLERGAMIHFGVPSYGIHVNGYVANPTTHRPEAIWIAQRSMSKATYPGMFDQVVAGGQPAGLSFLGNCAKECEEEASLPPHVVRALVSTGLISYKYTTRKGLSTKVLATFDIRMPQDLVPACGDGEVEDFRLWTIEEALLSVREQLPLWKPNSALVMIDFGMRHGFISPDDPGYAEISHLLRAGLCNDDLRSRF